MLSTLTIRDESMFGLLHPPQSFTLNFETNFISVRELIQSRVQKEVEDYNSNQTEYFRGLVQPSIAEQTLNGFKMPKEKKFIDWREQYKKAIAAFEHNGFIVLVDDYQIEGLDEIIEIEKHTSVTFLKLVPLVGG